MFIGLIHSINYFFVENFKLQSDLRKVEDVSYGCELDFLYNIPY